jgi:hypothetical protein
MRGQALPCSDERRRYSAAIAERQQWRLFPELMVALDDLGQLFSGECSPNESLAAAGKNRLVDRTR